MSKQLDLFEALNGKNGNNLQQETKFHVEGMENNVNTDKIRENLSIVCGCCGSAMYPTGSNGIITGGSISLTHEGEDYNYDVKEWMYRCGGCRKGSAKIYKNKYVSLSEKNPDRILTCRKSHDESNTLGGDLLIFEPSTPSNAEHSIVSKTDLDTIIHNSEEFKCYMANLDKSKFPEK